MGSTSGTAVATVIAALVIGAAVVAPSMIRANQLDRLRSSCWSQTAQSGFKRLATGMLEDQITDITKSNPHGSLPRAQINASTDVKASDFHTVSIDEKSGSAHCGALVDFTFKRADGKLLQNQGSVVEFELHPSEQGNVVTVARSEIFRHIIESASRGDD